MKLGRILIAGVIVALVRYLLTSASGFYFKDLYDPLTGLWRAMMTPSWVQSVILANLIIAFLLVFGYMLCHKGFGKKADMSKKGLKYGLLIWLISDIPGGIMTYVFMPVTSIVVISWVLPGLVINLINGLIIAHIYK